MLLYGRNQAGTCLISTGKTKWSSAAARLHCDCQTAVHSKKNGKYFVACDAYPKCRNTFSLPPNGTIKKAEKICEKCGFPLMMSLRKGKKPWIFCFNTGCESNKERLEEYKKKQELEQGTSKNH